MPKVFSYKDQDLGTRYIVISKIREISKTFGELVITFDNGDKHVISVEDPAATLKELVSEIERT